MASRSLQKKVGRPIEEEVCLTRNDVLGRLQKSLGRLKELSKLLAGCLQQAKQLLGSVQGRCICGQHFQSESIRGRAGTGPILRRPPSSSLSRELQRETMVNIFDRMLHWKRLRCREDRFTGLLMRFLVIFSLPMRLISKKVGHQAALKSMEGLLV